MNEEQWVMSVYQKGKESYDRGDYASATSEWDKLSAVESKYPAFKTVIDYLRGRTKNISPDSADQVEQKLAARKKQIDAAFQKGKELYDQGNMNGALAEWDNLASYLPEDAPLRSVLDDLRRYYAASQQTVPAAGPAKIDSTEMQKFFATAGELFKTQAEQSKAALEASDSAQKVIDESFSKAKLLYYQGNYPDAMREIEKLAPYFSDGSSDRKNVESLARVYQQSLDEKSSAEKAMKQKSVKAKLPADFQQFTSEVDEKFRAELKESETQKNISEKSLTDKQSWSSVDFQKGADLYRQGKTDEAVRLWESVASEFENERAMRSLIDTVKKNQVERARIQKELEDAIAEKQALVNGRLEKGRLLYEAGNFDEAKREWTSVKSLVDDGEKIDGFIAQMQQVYQDSAKVKQGGDEARAAANARVKTPDSLAATLATAHEKLTAEAAAADAKKKQAEQKAIAEKDTLIKNSLEKGTLLFEQGDFAKAETEWTSIEGSLDDPQKLRDFIVEMKKIDQQRAELNKTTRDAEAAAAVRLPLPAAFTEEIGSARKQLQSKTQDVSIQKQKADTAIQERQALLNKTIASGKALMASGNYADAVKEWAALLPLVDGEAALKTVLDGLQSDYEAAQKTEGEARDAEAKKNSKAAQPGDLSALLLEAGRQIRAQNDSASSRTKQAEQAIVDRQAFVTEHFTKGKVSFDAGNYGDALKEWVMVIPRLEDEAKLKPLADQAAAGQQNLETAQKAALESEARKDQKLKAPGDLAKLLTDANAKISADIDSAKARSDAAGKTYSQRQVLVQNTFEKGESLYKEGRYSEAVKEWSAIVDELEGADTLRASMKQIGENYELSISAQKAAEQAETNKGGKLPAPPTMAALLTEIQQKIQAQTETETARKTAAEKVLADRRARLDSVFAKGKLALDAGKPDEALKEWSDILSEFEEEARLRQMITAIQTEEEAKAKASQDADGASARQTAKITAPPELEKSLTDFLTTMKGETSLAETRRQKYDTEFEDRKTLVRNTYLKGLSLFDEGKYPEALGEWSNILPEVEGQPQLQEILDKATRDFQNLALAQKAVADAESRRGQKLKAPDELAQHMKSAVDKIKLQSVDQFSEILDQEMQTANINKESAVMDTQKIKSPSDITNELTDAREKLKERTVEAEAKRKVAAQALSERQAALQTEFDRGKKLYWDGKLSDAIQVWTAIAPQLEDEALRQQIATVSQLYGNLLSTQKDTQEAELRKDNKLKAPEELPKLLGDMNQIVQSQTQYADTQKKIADQTYVDRQALINTTFQKGKNLYEQDRIPEALEEWASISPYLEKGSELKGFIDSVARSYQESQTAKRAADEAQLKKTIKFQTPADLSKYLTEASEKMKAQVEDSQMQKEAADRSRAERQVWVDGKFEHGKLLYQQGNVTGAVDEWKTILPYIEDDSKVRQLILKAEENKQALAEQKVEAQTAPPAPPKIVIPPDLGKSLEAANADLEKGVAKKSREKLDSDVRDVIQEKKKKSKKEDPKKAVATPQIPLDEIEQMMLEYNIATPQELEKRHQEMKAIK